MPQTDLLDSLLANPRIPTLPAAAMRVLEKVGSPDCTLDAVGEIVRQDPALCGLIVKTLNSALYSFSRPVVSVDKALVMLGLTRIRSLILTLYLPAIKNSCPPSPLMADFWRSSVIGAIVTRELSARSSRRDPEADLLAALMRDLGQLVLHQAMREPYEQTLRSLGERPHGELGQLEQADIGLTHADVSGELLRRWRLPEGMWKAVLWHHRPELANGATDEIRSRTTLLHFASLASDFFLRPLTPGLRQRLLDEADASFGLDEAGLAEFLAPLNEKAAQMASFLNVDLGTNENYATILATASEELVRLAMESSLESLRAQDTVRRAEAEAANWREQATRDSLTGLYNRSHLVTALEGAIDRARRHHTAVGLLFIDLDGFKPVNDRFGHSAGDTVLKEVGAQLRTHVRNEDVVARFGGDEFCVLLPDTSEAGARLVGERIVRVLNDLPLTFNGTACHIGASIGATVGFPWVSNLLADELVSAADRAMYTAKKAGKNRVAIESMLHAGDRQVLDTVRQKSFREFLVRRGRASAAQLDEAIARRAPKPCLQRVARRFGWLTRDEAIRITRAQRYDGRTFEEAARECCDLRPDQIWAMIACRQEPPEHVARRVAKSGLLTEAEARHELKAYYESLGARRRELVAI